MSIIRYIFLVFILFGNLFSNVSDDNIITANNPQDALFDLTLSDFCVSDGIDTIALDSLSCEMIIQREKIEFDDPMNFNVEYIYGEEYTYRAFPLVYENGVQIYLSNLNYDKKGQNFDTYHITQITISDSSFLTPRGIKVGSAKEEVISKYGEGIIAIENDRIQYTYRYEDKGIRFIFNDLGEVEKIILYCYIGDNEIICGEDF